MSRAKQVNVFALNVNILDENKRNYFQLFYDAWTLGAVVQFNVTHAAALIALSNEVYEEEKYLCGLVYRFINVAPPYFDMQSREMLVNDDGTPQIVVAPHIKSNTKEINFCFLSGVHRIIVDSRNISHTMAREFFTTIFSRKEIVDKYGDVEVVVHADHDAVDVMLEHAGLRSVEISIVRPNPVGASRYDEEVLAELDEQRGDRLRHAVSGRSGQLKPNQKTRTYMYAAASLGRVDATAKDEMGGVVSMSTDDIPIRDRGIKDARETYYTALIRTAQSLWRKIVAQGYGNA